MERLDKLLASQGLGTRSEVQKLIRGGGVTVDGAAVRDPSTKCDPEKQALTVGGRPLGYKKHLYVMLNKPAGILCVSRDPKAATVVDLLPPALRRRGMFPAGRLDKDTHGLVLLTDDGDYAHRCSPLKRRFSSAIRRCWTGPADDRHVRCFTKDKPRGRHPLPAGKVDHSAAGDRPLVEVEICEGKYHQIKRMFEAVGRKVLWLKRYAIGGLVLDPSLPEEKCRELTPEETASVFFRWYFFVDFVLRYFR